MIRTKFPKQKRKGTQGRFSEYYRIWNETHPNDLIIPNTGFIIHHIDENPNNNDPYNLQKMTDIEHKKLHTSNGKHPNQGKKFSDDLRKKLSIAHRGHVPWNKGKTGVYSEETRKKMGLANISRPSAYGMLGKTHSEETKRKMSQARMGHATSEETKKKIGKTNKKRYWERYAKNKKHETS